MALGRFDWGGAASGLVAGIESDMYSSIWRMKFFLCSLIV